jgi:RimJ/RimL family protein N-acetyltransferase
MRLLVEFGFFRRIHLQAIVSNAAALRSYEKAASWSKCGTMSTHGPRRYEDILLMAILRSDTTRPTRHSIPRTPAQERRPRI